jgi:hypothetical protein
MTERFRFRILAASLLALAGSAAAQTTVPTKSSIVFSPQTVATSSPAASVAIKNEGVSNVAVALVEAPPDVKVGHQCTAVPSGASCALTLTFAPANFTGALTDSLPITRTIEIYAQGATVPHVITLTGVAEKSLVSHFYRSILRRDPDDAGKAYWNAEALRVSAAGADMSEAWFALGGQFFSSVEYATLLRTDRGYVVDLYQTFFAREPDDEGLAYWIGLLAAGMPRAVARTSFMFSTEFTNFTRDLYGASTVRPESNMVMDFYRGLLGRLPDDVGFAAWLARFRAAQCTGAAAVQAEVEAISAAFANSSEYAGRSRTHTEYVSDLYDAFLRRGGDLAGVDFWIGQLTTGARTRDALRKEFMNSPEFRARIDAVIGATCNPTT